MVISAFRISVSVVYILYSQISTDPGLLLKIRHSHRFVAVVIQILISFALNKKMSFRLAAGLVSLKVQKPWLHRLFKQITIHVTRKAEVFFSQNKRNGGPFIF